MTLILDTDNDILLATDIADMTRQLLALLAEDPKEETLIKLAAVLGCDVLDIVITHA